MNSFSAFETLKGSTHCPFAKRSRIRFSPPWNPALGFDNNVAIHARALADFVVEGERDALHGFVSGINIGDDARNFDRVREAFRVYLISLGRWDENCRRSLEDNKLSRDWQFCFGAARMFLNVFAPCYPHQHSKFIDSPDLFWVFFQPEYSFDLCGINPSKVTVKDGIRAAFQEAGMAYDGARIDERIEALLYMFPMRSTDEPVRWWD